MQCTSSQTTEKKTFRKTHPILIKINLPQSLRTSLAEHIIMTVICTCRLILSICVSRSGKRWKHLYPLIILSCSCRPAEAHLFFLCIWVFCHKQLSQDYKGLRTSPSVANLLPTVTLMLFWYIFQGLCLVWNFPTSLPPTFAFFQFECEFGLLSPTLVCLGSTELFFWSKWLLHTVTPLDVLWTYSYFVSRIFLKDLYVPALS